VDWPSSGLSSSTKKSLQKVLIRIQHYDSKAYKKENAGKVKIKLECVIV
jgi:hypothetical protein